MPDASAPSLLRIECLHSPCLDDLLEQLQHQDNYRSQLLRAIENKAANAFSSLLSVQNYFENQQRRAQGAHYFNHGESHNPRR